MTDAPGFAGVSRRWGADSIPVVLAEDSPLVRRRLLVALEAHPQIEVVAEATEAGGLLDVVVRSGTGVVVVGSDLPPDGAGPAVGACRRARPSLGAVIVVGHGVGGGLPLPRVVSVPMPEADDRLVEAVLSVA